MTQSLGDALAAALGGGVTTEKSSAGKRTRLDDGEGGALAGLTGTAADVVLVALKVAGLDPDEVEEAPSPADSLIDDLGLDSLGIVELAVRCEEATGVRFEDADIAGLTTLGDVIDHVDAGRG